MDRRLDIHIEDENIDLLVDSMFCCLARISMIPDDSDRGSLFHDLAQNFTDQNMVVPPLQHRIIGLFPLS